MKAVLDTNVLVSALLAPSGSPAAILRAWTDGAFELVASPKLLDELRRVLAYPKLQSRITSPEADEFIELVRGAALVVDDTADAPTIGSDDPAGDYLIALAETTRSFIVTGDSDLLKLSNEIPVFGPADFLQRLKP